MKALIIVIIVLCSQVCIAQEVVDVEKMILKGKEDLQKAKKANDVDQLMASKKYFIDLLSNERYEELIHYYIGYADFNLFNIHFEKKDKKAAKKFISDGIKNLKKAVKIKDDFAEGYALLSWLYIHKAAVKPLSAMSSGPKSKKFYKKALELVPENPRALFYAGAIKFSTPGMFGGSKEEGLKLVQKSVDSFKTFKPLKPFYPEHSLLDANVFLGICHMELDNLNEAQYCFEKALEIDPDNDNIENELMAQLEEKRMALNEKK